MRPTDRVWYVGYGSNLARRRLLTYVRGGRTAGPDRAYPGCRDRTDPTADRLVHLDHRLGFGRRSPRWGGGVAFVSVERDDVATIGRAWLVTASQLADIVAQENGGDRLEVDSSWHTLGVGASTRLGNGWYDHLLRCEPIDGFPAFTVTGTGGEDDPNRPTDAYVDVMREGLTELGLDRPAAERYLSSVGAWG